MARRRPRLDAFDLLVIMGGAMSIHEHRNHPWLPIEKRFLAEAIRARKPILGICLGAQLLADVLGGKVFQNPVKEIGWFPVRMLDRSAPFAAFPERLTVMHWHGDTFTIPEGARHVAESDACANQAFVHGDRVVGLQFHIELEKVGIEDLAAASLDEAGVAPFIQSREQLIAPPPESSAAQRRFTRCSMNWPCSHEAPSGERRGVFPFHSDRGSGQACAPL